MSRRIPQLSEKDVRAVLDANGIDNSPYRGKAAIVAVRGYYLDSMGKPNRNDRRVYDDAMFLVSPRGVQAYQANTDPNGYRKGHGTGAGKGMAMLKPGIHLYGTGKHKGRLAFRQCEVFTVVRDGDPPYDHCGWHAINLHSGGSTSTSSLGCQTVPSDSWTQFRSLAYAALEEFKNPLRENDWGQKVRSLPYILLDETERRAGNLVVSGRYLR